MTTHKPPKKSAPRRSRAALGAPSGKAGLKHRNFAELLERELTSRQRRNPAYSLRAFGRDIGVEPSTLSQVLAGKRQLPLRKVRTILDALRVSDDVRRAVLLAIAENEPIPKPMSEAFYDVGTHPDELIESWLMHAILGVFDTKGFQSDVQWIARRLGAEPQAVERILQLLEEQEMVNLSVVPWTKPPYSTTTRPTRKANNAAIIKVKAAYIEKGISALLAGQQETSEFSGMTFATCTARLAEAMHRIKEFRQSLATFLSEIGGDEVYRLNIELFPISKPVDESPR